MRLLRKALISHGTGRGPRRRVLRSSSSNPLIRSAGGADAFRRMRALNLIANGFYVRTSAEQRLMVATTTSRLARPRPSPGDRVEVSIRDNGTGMTPDVNGRKDVQPVFHDQTERRDMVSASPSATTLLSSNIQAQSRLIHSLASSPKSGNHRALLCSSEFRELPEVPQCPAHSRGTRPHGTCLRSRNISRHAPDPSLNPLRSSPEPR